MNIVLYGVPAETAGRIADRYGLKVINSPDKFDASGTMVLVPSINAPRYLLAFYNAMLRHEDDVDAEAARKGWARCADLLRSGEYDVVILDELTIALHFGLLSTAVVLDVLRSRHPAVEVVITGRYAPQALIDAADLVTEMCDVKHYYTQGVLSRDGIDR